MPEDISHTFSIWSAYKNEQKKYPKRSPIELLLCMNKYIEVYKSFSFLEGCAVIEDILEQAPNENVSVWLLQQKGLEQFALINGIKQLGQQGAAPAMAVWAYLSAQPQARTFALAHANFLQNRATVCGMWGAYGNWHVRTSIKLAIGSPFFKDKAALLIMKGVFAYSYLTGNASLVLNKYDYVNDTEYFYGLFLNNGSYVRIPANELEDMLIQRPNGLFMPLKPNQVCEQLPDLHI